MPVVFIDNASGAQALGTTIAATFPGSPAQGDLMIASLFTKRDTSPTNPSGWTTDIEIINGGSLDYLRVCSKTAGAGESATGPFTGMAGGVGGVGGIGVFRAPKSVKNKKSKSRLRTRRSHRHAGAH